MIGAGVTTSTADCQYCHPCQDSLLLSPLVPDDGDSIAMSMSTTSVANPTTTLLISPILKLRQFLNFLHMVNFFPAKCRKHIFTNLCFGLPVNCDQAPGEWRSLEDLLCPSP